MDQPIPLLTIAGSDSGGAAGAQADLKTWAALGVYGMSALTAVTAQNSMLVQQVHFLPPEMIAAQIDAVLSDYGAAAIKTGFLGRVDLIEVIAERLAYWCRGGSETRPYIADPGRGGSETRPYNTVNPGTGGSETRPYTTANLGTGGSETRPYNTVNPGTGGSETRPYTTANPGTGGSETRPYNTVNPGTGGSETRPYTTANLGTGGSETRPYNTVNPGTGGSETRPYIVIDPVLVNHRGEAMFGPDVADAYRRWLLPLADLVTPNAAEARLLGIEEEGHGGGGAGEQGGKIAAARVLIKAARRSAGEIVDIYWDGARRVELPQALIDTANTHGSGDTLSAAICAFRAAGHNWLEAIRRAQAFTHAAIQRGAGWRLGAGHGPLGHAPAESA